MSEEDARPDAVKPVMFLAGLAILALLTWARLRMIDALPDQGYFAKYTIVADQILAGHLPRERLLDFSPLYLWFIVALRAMGAGFHAIRTLQIVMVSVAAALAPSLLVGSEPLPSSPRRSCCWEAEERWCARRKSNRKR